MPFHTEHALFEAAEAASYRAEHTTKKNQAACRKNNLLAAEAHKRAAETYRAQNGTDHAGGSYLKEKTTWDVAKVYAAHELRAKQHSRIAKEYSD
jgi:predicted Ser/Thr protein kinase